MSRLLAALKDLRDVDIEDLRSTFEWDQARRWGWIMDSGELTGTGLGHAGELPGGLLKD